MCQSARVVSLLTAYARDHGEAWTYVAPLVELMRFIAADRNDMVDEAAGAAPSERVLDELARLGAMLCRKLYLVVKVSIKKNPKGAPI